MFTVRTQVPGGLARTGTLHLAHGDVRTPAFVPLATKGAVKTLEPRDVVALGYEMVLGNTFHLLLAPGPERVREFGGLHEFMRWNRAIITDSGGFQVFSMGHGGVADEIKGRGRGGGAGLGLTDRRGRRGRFCPSTRRASAFGPMSTGASAFSLRKRPCRSRPRSARTSRSCSTSARRSTSRATTQSGRWSGHTGGSSAACAGMPRRGRRDRRCMGSSRVASTGRCGSCPPKSWPVPGATGSRSAARSARTRRRCIRWWSGRRPSLSELRPTVPATYSGSATSTT